LGGINELVRVEQQKTGARAERREPTLWGNKAEMCKKLGIIRTYSVNPTGRGHGPLLQTPFPESRNLHDPRGGTRKAIVGGLVTEWGKPEGQGINRTKLVAAVHNDGGRCFHLGGRHKRSRDGEKWTNNGNKTKALETSR